MDNLLTKIKWAGLYPSMNVFSGEVEQGRVSLIAMGGFYEIRVNVLGVVLLKKVNKAYLSVAEKKEIIFRELLRSF